MSNTMGDNKDGKEKLANPVPYRFDLLDPEAITAMAMVMAEGAKDHEEEGWRRMSVNDILNHAIGHILQHMMGNQEEDHLAHAMCRAMMAWANCRNRPKKSQDFIYLCYPYKDDPERRTRIITEVAREIQDNHHDSVLFVPHFVFQHLSENLHRKWILELCKKAISLCTTLVVVGRDISDGMEVEIEEAHRLRKPIIVWTDEKAKEKVREMEHRDMQEVISND